MLDIKQTGQEHPENQKHIIYQLLVRYFGNKKTTNKVYGTLAENGCGKFNDITAEALQGLKQLGVTHVWYTGVIEHAKMTDYSAFGIKNDDPDVVKGIAGSPYAIKDYFDVDPDLAVEVRHRMAEFEALLQRTHAQGLKAMIDFVPNHVARTYQSDVLPTGITDLGANDNLSLAFDPKNDFYYIPHQKFLVPYGYQPGGDTFSHPLKDGVFDEFPAKVTGNNIFRPDPGIGDWFETIKLNYGWDVGGNGAQHFEPRPPLWDKMLHILLFWAKKGVNGFRCDIAEMVPVAFWHWAIKNVKQQYPDMIFVAEAYNTGLYRSFISYGGFDFLYDKDGMYDATKRLVTNAYNANVSDISYVWKEECKGIQKHMLRFLENHDEVRIASGAYAGNPWYATPAMVVASTLFTGPIMIYNGQEVGEDAQGEQGFSGNDGRSTIFDYWGLPVHQRWMNGGKFDGGQLSDDEQRLRGYYAKLFNICRNSAAICQGQFYELMDGNALSAGFNGKLYAFVRFYNSERLLILANFNRYFNDVNVYFPDDLKAAFDLSATNKIEMCDLLSGSVFTAANFCQNGIKITMYPTSALILRF